MKLSLFCICLCIISFGFVTTVKRKNDNNLPVPTNDTTIAASKKYLALGDSYTIGQSVHAEERYPYLTVSLLRRQGFRISDPHYIATTGWTTNDLMKAINNHHSSGTFDIVTLLIGVNDQYQGLDTNVYKTRFTQLLNKAIALSGNHKNHVFVLSIPDYSCTPFVGPNNKPEVSKAIDDFNAINKQICTEHNIAYIDVTALSKEAANDNTLLAYDRLHYSAKEYQKWAELLALQISKVMSQP